MTFRDFLTEQKKLLDFIPGRKEKRVKAAAEKHGDMLVKRARETKSRKSLDRAFQWNYSNVNPDFDGYKKDQTLIWLKQEKHT